MSIPVVSEIEDYTYTARLVNYEVGRYEPEWVDEEYFYDDKPIDAESVPDKIRERLHLNAERDSLNG